MALTSKKLMQRALTFPSGIFRAEYPYLYRRPEGLTEEQAFKYYIDSIYKVFEECAPADEIAADL